MPHTVQLLGPNRLNIGGRVFEKGIKVPVSYEEALEFDENPRFKVRFDRSLLAEKEQEVPQTNTAPKKPATKNARIKAIQDAAADLDFEKEENWTAAGLPDARALSAELGWTVTADERDEAMQGLAPRVKPVAAPAEKHAGPKGNITIRKTKGEAGTLDTGAELVDDTASAADKVDTSTEGAVEV
jgi:hypothetical protein